MILRNYIEADIAIIKTSETVVQKLNTDSCTLNFPNIQNLLNGFMTSCSDYISVDHI